MGTRRVYGVVYSNSFEASIRRLPKQVKEKINEAIEELRHEPRKGRNIKSLKGKLSGFYRYRLGRYRLVYSIEEDEMVLLMVDFGPRGDVYK